MFIVLNSSYRQAIMRVKLPFTLKRKLFQQVVDNVNILSTFQYLEEMVIFIKTLLKQEEHYPNVQSTCMKMRKDFHFLFFKLFPDHWKWCKVVETGMEV